MHAMHYYIQAFSFNPIQTITATFSFDARSLYSDFSLDDIDADLQEICRAMTIGQFYDLGVALGWSPWQLDIIQYRAKPELITSASAHQTATPDKDGVKKSACAAVIGWRVQPIGHLTAEQVKMIWESIQAATNQEQGTNLYILI